MKKQIQKTTLAILTPTILMSSGLCRAANTDDHYIYFGIEGGISEPIIKDFEETVGSDTMKMHLKQSRMYGGRVGYSFYPGVMVELSATHQPKYRLAYRLPATTIPVLIPGVGSVDVAVKETPDITKISADAFMLNLLYQFQEQYAGVKPYVIFGAGVSRVNIRPQETAYNVGGNELVVFKVQKNKMNCLSWQFGGGVTRDITDNLSIDLGVQVRIVNGLKLKYETLSSTSGEFERQKPIKKTLGAGEFTLSFLFKLPV